MCETAVRNVDDEARGQLFYDNECGCGVTGVDTECGGCRCYGGEVPL